MNNLIGRHGNVSVQNFNIDGIETDDPKHIAQAFNRYFVLYPETIQNNIPDANCDFSVVIPLNPNTMFLYDSTEFEVDAIIRKIDKNGSIHDITMTFIITDASRLSIILSDFFNFCAYKQSYPDPLKISNVTPVHKKNSKGKIENYRPVSVLSNLSKVFENLLYDRLRSLCTRYNLLSNRQYGFRKNRIRSLR